MTSILRTAKTWVLVILVALSLILSYFLWSGNLKEGSDINLVQPASLPTATTPDFHHAVRPYLVTLWTPEGKGVARPESADYNYWASVFTRAHTSDPTTVHSLPSHVSMQVTFQFGLEVNRMLAAKWLSNSSAILNGWQGRTIVLYELPKESYCRLAFVGDNSIVTTKTDISALTLSRRARSEVTTEPYDTLGDGANASYIPRHIKMMVSSFSVRQPDTLPLVHTFFVNPQAITRIQQDKNTTLWTDGSRAVQWNQSLGEIRYEDPNSKQSELRNDSFQTSLDFIHNHGGGPQDVIGFDQIGQLTGNPDAPTYAFAQYMNGYPILSNEANYDVDIEGGHVIEYTRPTWVLQQSAGQTSVSILNKTRLIKALKTVDPNDNPNALHVELGYTTVTANTAVDEVTLQPVYYITSSSGSTWMLSATDGTLLSGSDAS